MPPPTINGIPIFFFIAVLGEELIKLFFGGKFLEYSHVLVGVYFFSILNAFQMPLGLMAQLKERADIMLYSKVFAVYNLIADIFLIKYFGIWGAVFATGTAVLGKNMFIWCFLRKEASFNGMRGYFLTSICFWMFVSSIVLVVKQLVRDDTMLLITGFVIFSASFGLQFRLCPFNAYEIQKLLTLAGENQRVQYILKMLRIQTP